MEELDRTIDSERKAACVQLLKERGFRPRNN